jgi:hypothetical protein
MRESSPTRVVRFANRAVAIEEPHGSRPLPRSARPRGAVVKLGPIRDVRGSLLCFSASATSPPSPLSGRTTTGGLRPDSALCGRRGAWRARRRPGAWLRTQTTRPSGR